MEGEDPWFWDTDRVVQELCTPARSWKLRSHNPRLPDPVQFEKALRENEVTGDILLTEVTDHLLKTDFGPLSLPQRASVRDAIKQFQNRSSEYRKYNDDNNQLSPERLSGQMQTVIHQNMLSIAETLSRGGDLMHAVRGSSSAPSTLQSSEVYEAGTPSNKRQKPYVPNAEDDIEPQLVLDQGFERYGSADGAKSHPDLDVISTATDLVAHTSPPEYAGATSDVPPNLKKRKRIAPILITSLVGPRRDIPTEADTVNKYDPQNIEPGVVFLGDDGKKRLIPIAESGSYPNLVRHFQDQPIEISPGALTALEQGGDPGLTEAKRILEAVQQIKINLVSQSLSKGYLGKTKYLVDQIFYGDTNIGSELSSVDEREEIAQVLQPISSGRRLYVNSVMKRYLRSKRLIAHRNGKRFSAICPYSLQLAPIHRTASFTLFNSTPDGNIQATREDLSRWPELNGEGLMVDAGPEDDDERRTEFFMPGNVPLGGPSSYDNWDPSVLEKYQYLEGGDTVLPVYGDSGDEGEYDLETWNEIEAEQGTIEKPFLRSEKRVLTEQEINEAVDEGISAIILKWTELKLPKRQEKAYKLWHKCKGDGSVRRFIREAQQIVDKLNNERLVKIRKEILGEVWFSQKQVRQQTQMMEPSIFDREDCLWKISILKNKTPPPRPLSPDPSAIKKRKRGESGIIEEDGESIEFETDVESSDDGLDGFIVPDDQDADHHFEIEDAYLTSSEMDMSAHETDEILTKIEETPLDKKLGKCCLYFQSSVLTNMFKDLSNLIDEVGGEDQDMLDSKPAGLRAMECSIEPHLPFENGRIKRLNSKYSHSIEIADAADVVDLTISSADEADLPPVQNSQIMAASPIELLTPDKIFKNPFKDYSIPKKPKIKFALNKSPLNEIGKGLDQQSSSIVISDEEDLQVGLPEPGTYPSYDDPVTIAQWGHLAWSKLNDSNRLLITVLLSLGSKEQESLFELFSTLEEDQLWSSMCEIMNAAINGTERIRGVNSETRKIHGGVLRLFWIYVECRYHPARSLKPREIKNLQSKRLLFTPFHDLTYRILKNPLGKPQSRGSTNVKIEGKGSSASRNRDRSQGSQGSQDSDADDDEPILASRSHSRSQSRCTRY